MRVSDRVDAVVLGGPWYAYDHHAWNEAVLATHFIFPAKRFRIASENFWGIPMRASGYFYEAHSQMLEGGLRFRTGWAPLWLRRHQPRTRAVLPGTAVDATEGPI